MQYGLTKTTDLSSSLPEFMPELTGIQPSQPQIQPTVSKFRQPFVPRRTEMRAMDREI